jgi:4-hydroxybenzoate polyprenyltransferase
MSALPIKPWLTLLRLRQWTKNVFCLGGWLFGDQLASIGAAQRALCICAAFCLASSAVYLLNDVIDIERDRSHPKKKKRPIASGQITARSALVSGSVLMLLSLIGGFLCGALAGSCIALYFVLNGLYTFHLKLVVLVDVMCIALGFMFRLLAGIYAVNETPTAWILLCSLFLTLFLGFAKRRQELADLDQDRPNRQRSVLSKYTVPVLDSYLSSTGSMAVVFYAMFSVTSEKNPTLVLTVPLVHYAIMRYSLLTRKYSGADEPERLLVKDRNIALTGLVWLVSYLGIVYSEIQWVR